jgi:hypothetical protein
MASHICASCKKTRTSEGSWNYVAGNADDCNKILFSHGICPK